MDSTTELELNIAKAHSALLEYPELEAFQRESPHHETVDPDGDDMHPHNLRKFPTAVCNRCRKMFAQLGPKPYKMCAHCRFLQRQRSKRWQQKTKSKDGVCRRCGTQQPPDSKFVLCLHCRDILRRTKASRVRDGRCVHCSGPNIDDGTGTYKVCKRCRDRDKLRRVQLEHSGNCNRCAAKMPSGDSHKLCAACRAKKLKENAAAAAVAAGNNLQLLDQLEVSSALFGDTSAMLEAGDHAQLNRQLSQISQISQFDIENLMHYDSEDEEDPGDSTESEMVAAVAAAINMTSHHL